MILRSRRLQGLMAVAVGVLLLAPATAAVAAANDQLSRGQTLYVPVYSHIYSGDREKPVYLAVTVSIRNTDPHQTITVNAVDYHNSEGLRIHRYLEAPLTLAPMATVRYVVKESDKAGGSGANFIVRWQSETAVNPPLVESIMISTASALGISFSSRGVPVVTSNP